MGVKDLWNILTPYAERKPICELRGKTVAIDLAGWVCESLNVVDYFVHPKHYLKNLFFRTCYLIWEDVTPIFVLEGIAPKLKNPVIEKRNELQFRGVKPRNKIPRSPTNSKNSKVDKGRTRFNHVLKQCENLLHAMGIQCVQGPGEAEAYCAFLNLKGLVDGVISQDSDCFAYGALRVYRNFSVSSQGALSAQGGAVDIYDMNNICTKMDFGQNKVIVMALLCGCDYCPEGIGGIGRDSVLKLFNIYKNEDILGVLRSWRYEDYKYLALEMRVDDKTICFNCGHMGRTQSHTKNGCGVCRTDRGCDESLWKEERLSLKAEMAIRKKALADPNFPSEDIIKEFLNQPKELPKLQLCWGQPNMVKFIRQIGHLLQWPEIYCFQKLFPILTRWQVINFPHLKQIPSAVNYVTPKNILKKRKVKGVPSLELMWQDEKGVFSGLIPEYQISEFLKNNHNGLQDLWSTIEPLDKLEKAYPSLVETFLKSKEKPKRQASKTSAIKTKTNKIQPLGTLENFNDIKRATNDISKSIKTRKPNRPKEASAKQGLQLIERFFQQKLNQANEDAIHHTPKKNNNTPYNLTQCSTPLTKNIPSDLESDIDENNFDMSDIVNGIIEKSNKLCNLTTHKGNKLYYEEIPNNISILINKEISNTKVCLDDQDILCEKRLLSNSFRKSTYSEAKRISSMDDSFDILVKKENKRSQVEYHKAKIITQGNQIKILDRFKKEQCSKSKNNDFQKEENITNFFDNSLQWGQEDEFQKIIEISFNKQLKENEMYCNTSLLSD